MNDPELLAEFVTESSEHLADIENQLLEIESAGADIDDDLVNTVFRGVHSIKGVAGFLGLTTINRLSHVLEDVLNRVRNRDLVPTPDVVEVMLKAADELTNLVNDPDTSNEVDVSEHLAALEGVLSADEAETEPAASAEPAAQPTAAATPDETDEADDADDAAMSDEALREVHAELVATEPEPDSAQDTNTPAKEKAKPPAAAAKAKKDKKEKKTTVDASIRVPVSTLDQLMNLAGEMVLNRNRLLQFSGANKDTDLASISSDIDHITCELQDAIMQTRMQPIGSAFNRFPRVVRDLSSMLGKQCELIVEGKDVEVDKSIIEAIGDPLTHLVRNSVDHGVELPDVREQAGKPRSGTVRLSAYHRTGQVCIDLEDDGGGIDPDRLKQKAVDKGVLTDRQAADMSSREALQLIFHPGFSTAEKLTDVSGRGVGMDVVRTNIERIGGTVDVESEIGRGTTIRIVLPLTLAIIRSLIVGCRNRRFALPQVNVAELVRVADANTDARFNRINDAVVFRLRGDLLPLVDLSDALGLESETTGDEQPERKPRSIVVLETGRSRYGLVVDEMHDSEEIVVKPLGRHLKGSPSLAGATILGDGRVALILDVAGIADKSQLASVDERAMDEDSLTSANPSELQTLLLFKNAPDEQFAIPMGLVERIERAEAPQIEEFGGRLLMQYRGGSLPLLRIEDVVTAQAGEELPYVSVVVLTSGSNEFGVIAPTIQDICDVPVQVDTCSLRENGVAGSQVIDGVTTRILDVFQMLETKYPSAVADRSREDHCIDDRTQTVLLAEDSRFFRSQVAGFLMDAGYRVVEAEDGADAWDTLQREAEAVDIVVTDIEMPNMNGWDFSRRVRSHEKFRNLPIIALTSLAGDENIQKGRECGIDEHQVKMDREHLLNGIHRQLIVKRRELVGAEL